MQGACAWCTFRYCMSEQPSASEPSVRAASDGPPPVAVASKRSFDLRYLNMLGSAVAVLVSTASMWLAYSSNRTQERLLAATSWPHLVYQTGNVDSAAQKDFINLSVENGGSGPAILHFIVVTHNGVAVPNANAFFPEGIEPEFRAKTKLLVTSPTTNQVIAPHDRINLLVFEPKDKAQDFWLHLNRVRLQLRFEACYCSIIGDCWMSDLKSVKTRPVETCPPTPQHAWEG
jgi:hypothetical protein